MLGAGKRSGRKFRSERISVAWCSVYFKSWCSVLCTDTDSIALHSVRFLQCWNQCRQRVYRLVWHHRHFVSRVVLESQLDRNCQEEYSLALRVCSNCSRKQLTDLMPYSDFYFCMMACDFQICNTCKAVVCFQLLCSCGICCLLVHKFWTFIKRIPGMRPWQKLCVPAWMHWALSDSVECVGPIKLQFLPTW